MRRIIADFIEKNKLEIREKLLILCVLCGFARGNFPLLSDITLEIAEPR